MKNIKEIEEIVDKIHTKEAGVKPKTKKRIRFNRSKVTAKGVAGLMVLIVGSMVAVAGVFGFFMNGSFATNATTLLEINGFDAEEYSTTFTMVDIVGNDTFQQDLWYNLSADADNPISFDLIWTSIDEGMTCSIWDGSTKISDEGGNATIELDPSDCKLLTIRIDFAKMLEAGTYQATLQVL